MTVMLIVAAACGAATYLFLKYHPVHRMLRRMRAEADKPRDVPPLEPRLMRRFLDAGIAVYEEPYGAEAQGRAFCDRHYSICAVCERQAHVLCEVPADAASEFGFHQLRQLALFCDRCPMLRKICPVSEAFGPAYASSATLEELLDRLEEDRRLRLDSERLFEIRHEKAELVRRLEKLAELDDELADRVTDGAYYESCEVS